MQPTEIRSVAAIIDHRLEAMDRDWPWFAQQLDVSAGFVSHIRTGRRSFSPELLRKAARVLRVSITDLEFAQAVAKQEVMLSLSTALQRAVAYQILSIWQVEDASDLLNLQNACQKILTRRRRGKTRTYKKTPTFQQ